MCELTTKNVQRFAEGRIMITEEVESSGSNLDNFQIFNCLIKVISIQNGTLVMQFHLVSEYIPRGSFRLVETAERMKREFELANFKCLESSRKDRIILVSECGRIFMALFEPSDPQGV
jgi:hypothetical protein